MGGPMQFKSSKLLTIAMLLITTMLMLSGCGKSGTRFSNIAPTISITSYEGWDNSYAAAGYDTTLTYSFQQRIYWHATDPDGVIAGYAFRVLDENHNPIASPGYQFISTADDDLTPTDLVTLHGAKRGWVVHYLPGADQSIPLSDPAARRSIWTSQKYATVNFPSADEFGNPMVKISYFEVVAIDNRGAITAQAAWRKFRTQSEKPMCTINTTKGNPNGDDVGSGIKLSFAMIDYDPFIPSIPYRFEFKMMKTNNQGVTIPGTETAWHNTDDQEKFNEYKLTARTQPLALTYDYEGNVAVSKTKIIARAYDMAGVVSELDTLLFRVRPGFSPRTFIYPTKTLALGDNHYEDWGDDSTKEILPYSIINGQQRYATPFFRTTEGRYTAVYSPNLKIYIRWGWWGEYGNISSSGAITYSDNPIEAPYNKKVDVALDRNTQKNYFSEITHFDIRYNGEPYNFPPFANSIATHDDGTRWLRIPVTSPLGQTIVLTGLPVPPSAGPGTHVFEVSCVDMQDEYDPIPAVLEFDLIAYKAPAQRSGILVIDDDPHHAANSPGALVKTKYENMFSDHTDVTFIKNTRSIDTQVETVGTTKPDVRGRHLAFSELMNYKLVVYHSDNPGNSGNMEYESDGLAMYLLRGGNLMISYTHKLSDVLSGISKDGIRTTVIRHMGLPDQPVLPFMSNSLATNPFFHKAVGQLGYSDVNLQFGDPASFNTVVELRKGLSAVAWFPETTGEIIYTLGCKPVDYPTFPPTQAQFNNYNGKPVGIRKTNPGAGKVYTFAFPLSYMLDSQAKALVNKVVSEVM